MKHNIFEVASTHDFYEYRVKDHPIIKRTEIYYDRFTNKIMLAHEFDGKDNLVIERDYNHEYKGIHPQRNWDTEKRMIYLRLCKHTLYIEKFFIYDKEYSIEIEIHKTYKKNLIISRVESFYMNGEIVYKDSYNGENKLHGNQTFICPETGKNITVYNRGEKVSRTVFSKDGDTTQTFFRKRKIWKTVISKENLKMKELPEKGVVFTEMLSEGNHYTTVSKNNIEIIKKAKTSKGEVQVINIKKNTIYIKFGNKPFKKITYIPETNRVEQIQ